MNRGAGVGLGELDGQGDIAGALVAAVAHGDIVLGRLIDIDARGGRDRRGQISRAAATASEGERSEQQGRE
ncbi:MAG: hypothetical protein ACI8S6_002245 [Myxococcota bacterium]|jgi:hypothetical protein